MGQSCPKLPSHLVQGHPEASNPAASDAAACQRQWLPVGAQCCPQDGGLILCHRIRCLHSPTLGSTHIMLGTLPARQHPASAQSTVHHSSTYHAPPVRLLRVHLFV